MAYQPSSVVYLSCQRGWLTGEAAASISRIDAQIGHCMQITEAGRTWDEQNAHYQHYLRYGSPIALNPDTPSVHQIGNAIDSDEAQNFVSRMEDNGWYRTVYRYVNGVWTLVERWHFEYFIARDNYRSSGGGGGTGDDDMFTDQDRSRLDAAYAALFGPANLGAPQMTWAKPFGEAPGVAYYGSLDIAIVTQTTVSTLVGQVAALTQLVSQLSAGGGAPIDMERVEKAAREGAKDALADLVLRPDPNALNADQS